MHTANPTKSSGTFPRKISGSGVPAADGLISAWRPLTNCMKKKI